MVQHAGAPYDFSQARTPVAPVEDMLSHAFQDVYGLEFPRYSFLALIANEDLRRWLEDAQQFLSEGEPTLTIAACNYAHRLVIEELQNRTGRRQPSWSRRLKLRGMILATSSTWPRASAI